MTRRPPYGPVGAVALACALAAPPASAADMAPVFKGRTATIVIGYDMGGTYGLYAQAIARHMGRHIPGNPTIIVQAMPGAGGIKASNYAYNVMPKEGLNWLMPPDGIVISNLLERDKVKYDSRRFQYIGTSTQTNGVLVVRSDTGVRTLDDLKKKQLIVSSSGTGSQTFLVPALLNGVFGTKFKIVTGYKGSASVIHAIEQKEADATSITWTAWSTSKPQWFKTGFARPIVQIGLRRDPRLPDLPMALELVQDPDLKKIVAFVSSLGPVGRGLALPPGAAKDRLAALRAAFDKTMADPAFLGESKSKNFDLNPIKGAEVQALIDDMMNISPDLVAKAREMIMGKGRRG